MSSWFTKLENWFAAVAFAEEGEHKTALELVGLKPQRATESAGVLDRLNTVFAAAAFAEANCHDMAEEILDPGLQKKSFSEIVGLKGIRVWYGFAPAADETFFHTIGLGGVPARLGLVRL